MFPPVQGTIEVQVDHLGYARVRHIPHIARELGTSVPGYDLSLYGDHTAALVSYITKKLSCVYLTDFWGNHFFTDANQTSINLAVLHFASDIRTCSKCTAVTQTVCIRPLTSYRYSMEAHDGSSNIAPSATILTH